MLDWEALKKYRVTALYLNYLQHRIFAKISGKVSYLWSENRVKDFEPTTHSLLDIFYLKETQYCDPVCLSAIV